MLLPMRSGDVVTHELGRSAGGAGGGNVGEPLAQGIRTVSRGFNVSKAMR